MTYYSDPQANFHDLGSERPQKEPNLFSSTSPCLRPADSRPIARSPYALFGHLYPTAMDLCLLALYALMGMKSDDKCARIP